MIEKNFGFTESDAKLIEQIIHDENVIINHVILGHGDSVPTHYSNSNVYQVIIRGAITLKLADQEEHSYNAPSVIQIPYNTKMDISNQADAPLEFFIVKAPAPEAFQKQ